MLATGVTLYYLAEGVSTLGREGSKDSMGSDPDIALVGDDTEAEHCVVNVEGDRVTLTPISGSTVVNGAAVTESIELHQGMTVVLGRDNIFRFNLPAEASKLRLQRSAGDVGNEASEGNEKFNVGSIFEDQRKSERDLIANTQKRLAELEAERTIKAEAEAMAAAIRESEAATAAAEAAALAKQLEEMQTSLTNKEQADAEVGAFGVYCYREPCVRR